MHSFETDVCRVLTTIGKILDRLMRGHCSSMIDADYFHLTGNDLKQFSVEIDECQFGRVVSLRHDLIEMEQTVAGHIITLMEWQLSPRVEGRVRGDVFDYGGRALSPIRNSVDRHMGSLFMASTPDARPRQRQSLGYIRGNRLSSVDSGYLLTPDNDASLGNSADDFDVIPFSGGFRWY